MTELAEIKKKSVYGAISYFIRTIFLNAVGIISALILSAYFSPEDFGLYGFVIQIIGLLIFFSDVGLAGALIQKKSEPTLADYRTTFTIQHLLAWGIVLLTLIISQVPSVVDKIGFTGQAILFCLALSFPLASLKTIPSVILERKLLFSKLVVPQVFEQIVFHSVLIVLAIQGSGAIAYAYAIIARSIIGVVTMYILQGWQIGLAFDAAAFKQLFNFGLRFQINDFLARLKDQLFYVILGLFMPLREFGYIQWAKNWSLYPYNLTVQNVMAITFPTFSRLQDNASALRKAIETSLFFITVTIFPILIGMIIFIQPFIDIMPVYQKWQPAVPSLIFFTLSIGWSAISSPLTNTLSAIGKINDTLRLMLMWTALTWALTPVALFFFGFNGVAVAALLISFSSYLSIVFVKKHIDFSFFQQVKYQLLASLCMFIVGVMGYSLWNNNMYFFALGLVISFAVYLISFVVFGRMKLREELQRIGIVIPFI